MTVLMNSGMHVVFTFTPDDLQRVVGHLFALKYAVPPPEGYDCYRLTPLLGESHRPLLRGGQEAAGPELTLFVLLNLQPSESSSGIELEVTFGIDADLDGDEVCVTVNYRRVTTNDPTIDLEQYGVGEILRARSPIRWWIPVSWLDAPGLPIVPNAAAATLVTYSSACEWVDAYTHPGAGLELPDHLKRRAVAIGVAVDEMPDADPDRFVRGIDLSASEAYVCPAGTLPTLPGVAISKGIVDRHIDLFLEDILHREQNGERLFCLHEDGLDYEITDLYRRYPSSLTDSTNVLAVGRINLGGSNWDMSIGCHVTFPGMYLLIHYPEDLGVDLSWNDHLWPEVEEGSCTIPNQSSSLPRPQFAVRPESLGFYSLSAAGILGADLVFNKHLTEFADFDSDTAAIETDKDALYIDFTYRYAGGHFRTCSGAVRPWVDVDDKRWSSFRVSNTGGVPVGIAVTTDQPDLLNIRGGSRTLFPGEAVDVSVEFRTDHLPRFYDPEAEEHFEANIYVRHSICDMAPVSVTFRAHVTYDLRLVRNVISDAERDALCGFADVMTLKYGLLALGSDYFEDHPEYKRFYTVGIRDEKDRYEFVAKDEEGDTVAMEAVHGLYKTLQIPVSEDDSMSLEVLDRTHRQPAKGPFYWTMRGFVVAPAAEVKVDGLAALAPCSVGAVAVGSAGVFLLDTTAPRRSAARLVLKDEQSLVAVASSKTDIYAVGGDRLLIMNVSESGEVEIAQSMTLGSSAHLIRRHGGRLWIAGQDQLTVLAHERGKGIKQLATTELKTSARDIIVYRGLVTMLVDDGLHFYALDGAELNLTGTYALKDSANATLTSRGELVGVTDSRKGTFFLDVSHRKDPEVVASYAKPYWKSSLAIDITRGVTYTTDLAAETATIQRFRALKIPK